MNIKIIKQSNSEIIPIIFVTLFFLAFSIVIYTILISEIIEAGISTYVIVTAIFNNTIEFSIATSFFILALYFIYIAIRPARTYKATLINKSETTYKNKQYCRLVFNVTRYTASHSFVCLVPLNAPVQVNNQYIIKIKDLNSKIKSIEQFNETIKLSSKDEFDLKILLYSFTLATLFMVIIIATEIMYFALDGNITFILFCSAFLFGFTFLLLTLTRQAFSNNKKEVEN